MKTTFIRQKNFTKGIKENYAAPFMTFIIIFTLILATNNSANACSSYEEIQLNSNPVSIEGLSVNHVLTFYIDKGKELTDISISSAQNTKTKKEAKEVFFTNGRVLRLEGDKADKENPNYDLAIKSSDKEFKLHIIINPEKSGSKSITRGGGCGGPLKIKYSKAQTDKVKTSTK